MNDRDPSELDPNEFRELLEKRAEEVEQRRAYGELSQSRAAIWVAVGIIFLVDTFAIVLTFALDASMDVFTIASTAIDVLLGIGLLMGKSWARTWMLIRVVLGLLIFGGMAIYQQDYGTATIQGGYCVALLILLTGTGTRTRITSGITLFVVSFVTGMVLALMPPSVATQEDFLFVEPEIPSHYNTYASEGLFSISYPPDWALATSVMEEMLEASIEWLATVDPEAAGGLEEVRMVFLAGKPFEGGYYPSANVLVYPKPLLVLTLDALVQADTQWAEANLQQYREYFQLKTTVDGREAIILDSSEHDPDMGTWRHLQLYTIKGNLVWVVSAACIFDDFKNYEDTFDQIIRSLRVFK